MPRPVGGVPHGAGFFWGMKRVSPAAGRKGRHSMRKLHGVQSVAAALAAGAFAVVMSGCGLLSIESWVKVIQAQSSGSVKFLGATLPLERVQGGFLGLIQVNTSQLPAPLDGTITIEDIRLAAYEKGLKQ